MKFMNCSLQNGGEIKENNIDMIQATNLDKLKTEMDLYSNYCKNLRFPSV